MALNATSSASATDTLSAATASAGASGADSEQRFLKLLVAQLNNQDPMSPLDNAQLTSQLAQLSTVSGIEKLNTAFESLVAQSGASQALQSASLIGRAVLVPGSGLALRQGEQTAVNFEMAQGADKTTLTITDAAGMPVSNRELGAVQAGLNKLSWDGLDDKGQPLPEGAYSFYVTATSGQDRVEVTPLTYADVASVSQGSAGAALNLANGSKAALSDVRLIL